MIDYPGKFSLNNNVAYVAGGAGLIGSEVTKALASCGAKTIIIDIDEKSGKRLKEELKKKALNIFYEKVDMADLENIGAKLTSIFKRLGFPDAWINLFYPRTRDWSDPVEKLSLDSWRKNVDTHMTAYSWISREIALTMKRERIKGSIINFGSIYGIQGNDFTLYEGTQMTSPMAYSAIKGGIINLTRYLASYFGKHGIRVNNICPGGILDKQNGKFIANYERKVPLKRMASPEDVAPLVVFLASEAAAYITGTTIMVDGGWSIC